MYHVIPRRRTVAPGIVALFGLLLSGCETLVAGVKFAKSGRNLDTGIIDYRIYDEQSGQLRYHFVPTSCFDKSRDDQHCASVFVDARRVAKAGDSISINLLYAYLCDFYEWAENPSELRKAYRHWKKTDTSSPCEDDPDNRAGTRGEIAVLASAFERGTSTPIKFQEDGAVEPQARVIYFSDDVREAGQPLNFSNLPIYGPVTYGGKPFFVRLYVIELDEAEVRSTASLLRSLATLGAKSFAPSSPVLATLTKVGDGFLQSKQDDTIAQYDLVLDGPGAEGTITAPMISGITAFVRLQDRNEEFPWHKYCVQLSTGKIFEKEGDNWNPGRCGEPGAKELHGYSYFTVHAKLNEPALEQDVFQTFTEFSAAPAPGASADASQTRWLDDLSDAVDAAARFDRARSLLANLSSSSPILRRQAQEAFLAAACPAQTDNGGRPSISRDQLFYLAQRAEDGPRISIDIDRLEAADGPCGTYQATWESAGPVFSPIVD